MSFRKLTPKRLWPILLIQLCQNLSKFLRLRPALFLVKVIGLQRQRLSTLSKTRSFNPNLFLWKRSFSSRAIDPVESAFDTRITVTSASRLPDSSVIKNEFNPPRPRVQFNEANLSQARNNLG